MKKKSEKLIAPWLPCKYEVADVSAIQALNRGDASEYQQKRALAFIINTVSATYDQTYFPDSSRDSDFSSGRRYPGLTLVKLLHLNLSKMKGEEISRKENPEQ